MKLRPLSSRIRALAGLLRDESGTASVEFMIVAAGLTGAAVVAGALIAPAVHGYADNLIAVSDHADQVLARLQNNTTS